MSNTFEERFNEEASKLIGDIAAHNLQTTLAFIIKFGIVPREQDVRDNLNSLQVREAVLVAIFCDKGCNLIEAIVIAQLIIFWANLKSKREQPRDLRSIKKVFLANCRTIDEWYHYFLFYSRRDLCKLKTKGFTEWLYS